MELDVIYNEDCVEGLKRVPDGSVDLVLTSPPYNIGVDYDVWDDRIPWDEYWEWCGKWLAECFRVLKPDGRIAVNHYLSFGTPECRVSPVSELYRIMRGIGYRHHTVALWTDRTLARKTAWGSWLSSSAPYISAPYECVLVECKEVWKKSGEGRTSLSKDEFVMLAGGLWDVGTETRGLTKANFPVGFADKAIRLLSYEGDVVLDPFMGSGTTAVAASGCGRRYIGFEISGEYCRVARKRIMNERTVKLF